MRFMPILSFKASVLRFVPPISSPTVFEWYSHSSLATSKIVRANSLVGVIMMIPVPFFYVKRAL